MKYCKRIFFKGKKKTNKGGNEMWCQIVSQWGMGLSHNIYIYINQLLIFHYILEFWKLTNAPNRNPITFLKWNSIFSSQIRILCRPTQRIFLLNTKYTFTQNFPFTSHHFNYFPYKTNIIFYTLLIIIIYIISNPQIKL